MIPIALALLLPLQAASTPEDLHRRMEKTLEAAKSLDLKITTKARWGLEGKDLGADLVSRIQIQGARLRFESSGSIGVVDGKEGKKLSIDLVSGDKRLRMRSTGTELKEALDGASPKGLPGRILSGMLRTNAIFLPDMLGEDFMADGGTFVDQQADPSGFRDDGREKLGGRAAVRIRYLLTLEAEGYASQSYRIRLWIDEKTGLPLKREIRPEAEESEDLIVETFETDLDARIDPKRFEIPDEGLR